MKPSFSLGLLLPLLFVASCSRTPESKTASTPPYVPHRTTDAERTAWLAKAEKHTRDGWTYLHIEGPPKVRGFQNGYLMSKEIRESLVETRAAWEYKSGMDWSWLVSKGAAMLMSRIDDEDLDELRGIVDGLVAAGDSTTLEEILTYNGIVELGGYWWPEEKKKLDDHSPDDRKDGCSSFIATGHMTKNGGIVLGHNTMCSYVDADCYVILDVVPEHGHRILMQTSPGWIHSGTDFFITDAGLVGSETTIGGFSGFDEKGIPEFTRMRRATQDAGSIDEWCDIMKKGNNGGYANAWLIGNVNSNEIARLELGLKYVGMERTTDGFYTGSNVAENLKIRRLETEEHEMDIRSSGVARRVHWKQLMRENAGRIDVELGKRFEADHYDAYVRKEMLDWRALCAHGECDSLDTDIPFEPAGTVDGKIVDSEMAKKMSFAARWGSACGKAFDAKAFLTAHPQFDWQEKYLRSRPSQSWSVFSAGEK